MRTHTFMPGDTNEVAIFYNLMRKWCAVFDWRQRTRKRCRDCFKTQLYVNKNGYRLLPVRGCDGCAEMFDCYRELRDYFTAEGAL